MDQQKLLDNIENEIQKMLKDDKKATRDDLLLIYPEKYGTFKDVKCQGVLMKASPHTEDIYLINIKKFQLSGILFKDQIKLVNKFKMPSCKLIGVF